MYRWRFKQSFFHSKTNLREANRWDWIWKSWDKNQTQQGERTEKNSLLLSCWRLSITTQPEKMLKTICYFNHLSDNDSETLLKKVPLPKNVAHLTQVTKILFSNISQSILRINGYSLSYWIVFRTEIGSSWWIVMLMTY